MNGFVDLLAFSGGFIVMSLELLGGKLLAPYFGSDIYVWGSIISVFMLALAVGYLVGGRLTLRATNLFRLGLIFITAACLLAPLLLSANAAMEWIFVSVEDVRYGSLLACTLLFFPPTLVLGIISPYCVRLLVDSTARSGAVAGWLYFMSTLGSALGTLLTSFYFVLAFDMHHILIGLTLALLAAGIAALGVSRLRGAPGAAGAAGTLTASAVAASHTP